MKKTLALIISIAAVASTLAFAAGSPNLTPAEAAAHIGETRTVCGAVASADYVPSMQDKPTFINLDKPYPNQIFTIMISGANRRSSASRRSPTRENGSA